MAATNQTENDHKHTNGYVLERTVDKPQEEDEEQKDEEQEQITSGEKTVEVNGNVNEKEEEADMADIVKELDVITEQDKDDKVAPDEVNDEVNETNNTCADKVVVENNEKEAMDVDPPSELMIEEAEEECADGMSQLTNSQEF
eukprot:652344_1